MPVLLHGQVGSEILRRECGIDDPEVLEAVWWHTTFNRGLGADCGHRIPGRQAGPGEGGPVPVPRPDSAAGRVRIWARRHWPSSKRSLWPRWPRAGRYTPPTSRRATSCWRRAVRGRGGSSPRSW